MIPLLKGLTKGQPRSGKRNQFVAPVALMVTLFLVGQAYWLSKNSYIFTPFSITKIDCDNCFKVGVVRDEENSRIMKMCPACFGVGSHTIRRFDEQDVLCVACGGIGRLESHGEWRFCNRCNGRGMHRMNDWKKIVEVEEAEEINNQLPTNNIQHSTSENEESIKDDVENQKSDHAETLNP
jgi:hypothetical protein